MDFCPKQKGQKIKPIFMCIRGKELKFFSLRSMLLQYCLLFKICMFVFWFIHQHLLHIFILII